MKLNIKNVDMKSIKAKTSSQQLLQAGCCCGGGSEGRTKKLLNQNVLSKEK
ncbi:hypothetical protein [Rummeliibacillus sp. SL167]|uniref:hypothetical protein n=1 Tax=Rummeliibacillus sp. SL167 TaxID=2579792 RepID=UPI00164886D3|nr:hypothetical protein [Rummeliibacillus sp. SL167]